MHLETECPINIVLMPGSSLGFTLGLTLDSKSSTLSFTVKDLNFRWTTPAWYRNPVCLLRVAGLNPVWLCN